VKQGGVDLIVNPSECARGLFFQRVALLVNSVRVLLVALMRGEMENTGLELVS